MAFDEEFGSAFEELEEVFGEQTFTWRAQEYLCKGDPVRKSIGINALGNPASIFTRVWVRTALFTDGTRPDFGQTIRLNGVLLQISETDLLSASVLQLTLTDPAGKR